MYCEIVYFIEENNCEKRHADLKPRGYNCFWIDPCRRVGHVWEGGACVGGWGMCGRVGHVWEGGACVGGWGMCGRVGHVWEGGACGGACVGGWGMCGRVGLCGRVGCVWEGHVWKVYTGVGPVHDLFDSLLQPW